MDGDNGLNCPSAGDRVANAAGHPFLALTKRQIVAAADGCAMPLVEIGKRAIEERVVREGRVIGIRLARLIVLVFRVLINPQVVEAVNWPLLHPDRSSLETS